MGKYAKIALVLLYVAQLAVLFKDQLTSLYKHAVETVQREASHALHLRDEAHEAGPMKEPVFLKRATSLAFDPNAALFAVHHVHGLMAISHHQGEHKHEPHPPHDDDKHKDRPKKRRVRVLPLREIMYLNLYESIRAVTTHPSSEEPRERTVLCAVLRPDALGA